MSTTNVLYVKIALLYCVRIQSMQNASTVLMVRPDHFAYNVQTAQTNPFMHSPASVDETSSRIRMLACREFDAMVACLRANAINVLLLPSDPSLYTPDAVFPNNWFSTHEDGSVVIYPMLTENRRSERRIDDLLPLLSSQKSVKRIIDYSSFEYSGQILESTGSMALDRVNKIAYAMLSPRTDLKLFRLWCSDMGYECIPITVPKRYVGEVYHTNLHIYIGASFAVVSKDVFASRAQYNSVVSLLERCSKRVIPLSLEQVYSFCGNILELCGSDGHNRIVLSETAYQSYTHQQRTMLSSNALLLPVAIPIIEQIGGGGVRCMMAEVF